MKDCTICSKIQTIKLTCSILSRERCKNRVLARNKGITQFNECFFHFYRPFFDIGSAQKVIKKPKQAWPQRLQTSHICIFNNDKNQVCTLCTCMFTIHKHSPINHEKWSVLQLSRRRDHLFFLSPNRCHQFNSKIRNTYFASWMIEKWLEKREVKFLLTFSLSFLNYILQHWETGGMAELVTYSRVIVLICLRGCRIQLHHAF